MPGRYGLSSSASFCARLTSTPRPIPLPFKAEVRRALATSGAAQPGVGALRDPFELAEAPDARRPRAHDAGAVERESIAVVSRLGLEALHLGRHAFRSGCGRHGRPPSSSHGRAVRRGETRDPAAAGTLTAKRARRAGLSG